MEAKRVVEYEGVSYMIHPFSFYGNEELVYTYSNSDEFVAEMEGYDHVVAKVNDDYYYVKTQGYVMDYEIHGDQMVDLPECIITSVAFYHLPKVRGLNRYMKLINLGI